MKKILLLSAAAMLVSGSAFAATDHYVLSDGNLVQHLKITKSKEGTLVSADVDYDSTASDAKPCTGEVSGEAVESKDKNEIIFKKHSGSDATSCELKIHLTSGGAKVEQSKGCDHFAPGACRFSTDNKEMVKFK